MRSVIMCVDDDKYVLHTLSEQLNEWFGKDYIISKAASGDDALEILDKFIEEKVSISVVISDYVMPGMRGDVFLQKVHEREPSIKTIMLTGHSAIDGVVFAINNAGLYRFISKPWDPKDLKLTITEATKSFEQNQVMTRLYEDSKSFHIQFADSTRNLKLSFDAALSTIISATENVLDKVKSRGSATHSLAVKYYAIELAKTQGFDDFKQFEIGFSGLIHEMGKFTLSDKELNEFDKAKRKMNFTHPIVGKVHERTCDLAEGFGGDYLKILRGIYRPYKPELPLNTRILAITNMFDIFILNGNTVEKAREMLLERAKEELLDTDLVKIFIKDVPVYKGENSEPEPKK